MNIEIGINTHIYVDLFILKYKIIIYVNIKNI